MSPKHVITFNLPEESEELKTTMNASNYYCALYDLYSYLRNENKWPPDDRTEKDAEIYHKIYEKFFEIISENEIEIP